MSADQSVWPEGDSEATGQVDGKIIGDTILLVVFAGLLWAAGAMAIVWVKTHRDMRAARILLARQTYMMRQMGVASGTVPVITPKEQDRRGLPPEDTVAKGE